VLCARVAVLFWIGLFTGCCCFGCLNFSCLQGLFTLELVK
jgi:hypothetical protein